MSYAVTVRCPACGDRFETRTNLLYDSLNRPVQNSAVVRLHGCGRRDGGRQ